MDKNQMEAMYKRFWYQIEYYESNGIDCDIKELMRQEKIFSQNWMS
jgi:hypothetical protein